MTAMTQQPNQLPDQPPAGELNTDLMNQALSAPDSDKGPDDPEGKPPSPAAPSVRLPKSVPEMTVAVGREANSTARQEPDASAPVEAANDGTWPGDVVSLLGRGKSVLTVTLVGGGPACISAVEELLQAKPMVRRRLEVFIVDDSPRDQLGRGAPFRHVPGLGDEYLYMNMYTESVQLNKLTRIIHGLLQELGTVPMSDFMKRCHVGDALAKRADRVLQDAATAGVTVTFLQGRAVDIRPAQDDAITVHVREVSGSQTDIVSHAVVLTIGNESASRYEKLRGAGYIDAPWSVDAGIHRIPPSARVAIAGTSLSAMDAASVLLAQGHRGQLIMFSPGGRLPGIRPLHASTQLKVLAPERLEEVLARQTLPLSLRTVVRLLKEEFKAQGFDWTQLRPRRIAYRDLAPRDFLILESRFTSQVSRSWGILKSLDDVIAPIWQAMGPDAQRFVLSKLGKFGALQWSAAPPTAHRVMSLLHSGGLSIAKASDATRLPEGGFAITDVTGSKIKADYFIDASGFAGRLDEFRDPLIVAMCTRRLLTPDTTGLGARVRYEDGRLLNDSGEPSSPIWAGACALTRGAFLLSNELGEATHSAMRSARGVAVYLEGILRQQMAQDM